MNRNVCLCLLLLFLTPVVVAHHSFAMFDSDRFVETEATVVEFQWTNPHVWIEIMVTDVTETANQWSIEGGGKNTLFRSGWRPNTFEPGDVISIRYHPMHDGSHAGGFIGARFPDGSTIGRWDE